MDYVIGWITVKPGLREEFMALSRGFVEKTRAEPGVRFFELLPSADSTDVVVAVESYATSEAHAAHVASPHFAAFWTLFQAYVLEGRLENVTAEVLRTDVVRPD